MFSPIIQFFKKLHEKPENIETKPTDSLPEFGQTPEVRRQMAYLSDCIAKGIIKARYNIYEL